MTHRSLVGMSLSAMTRRGRRTQVLRARAAGSQTSGALQPEPLRLDNVLPTVFRLSSVVSLIALTVVLSGCAVFSPVQTSRPYVQADGVALDIDGVEFENLVVVAPSRGARGVLTGQAVNLTGRAVDVTVSLQGGTTPVTFTLAPFAGDGITRMPTNVDLGPVPVIPGALVRLTVSTSAAGDNEVEVPVLPPGPDLDYYGGIAP